MAARVAGVPMPPCSSFLSLSLSFNNFLIVGSVTKSATRTSAASKEASVNNGGGVVFFSLTITSFVVSVSPVRIYRAVQSGIIIIF